MTTAVPEFLPDDNLNPSLENSSKDETNETGNNENINKVNGDSSIKMTLFDREQNAIALLLKAIEERVRDEREIQQEFDRRMTQTQKSYNKNCKTLQAQKEESLSNHRKKYDETIQEIDEQNNSRFGEILTKCGNDRTKFRNDFEEKLKNNQSALQDSYWTAESVAEAGERDAKTQFENIQREAIQYNEQIQGYWNRTVPYLSQFNLPAGELPVDEHGEIPIGEPLEVLENAFAEVETKLQNLHSSWLRFFGSNKGLITISLSAIVLAILTAFLMKDLAGMLPIFVPVFLILSIGGQRILRIWTKKEIQKYSSLIINDLQIADHAREAFELRGKQQMQQRIRHLHLQKDLDRRRAEEKYNPIIAKLIEQNKIDLAEVDGKEERRLNRVKVWYEQSTRLALEHYEAGVKKFEAEFEDRLNETESLYQEELSNNQNFLAENKARYKKLWFDRTLEVRNTIKDLLLVGQERFADWETPFWDNIPKFTSIPQGIQFGKLNIDLHNVPDALPLDSELKPPLPAQIYLPAYLPFPQKTAVILQCKEQGKTASVQALQAIMLRFLTANPPGKVRFTVIDPSGLGNHFAAFMYLADYDEHLIGARIWTETAQIEKKLSDLTEHMENVIQKYLRNQYRSIEEYNQQAGEVAEPFRVLVIANFPANFSLEAARRLVSIATSGSVCGVYTLLSWDSQLPLPQGFNKSELDQICQKLVWKENQFLWQNPVLGNFPLQIDQPPDLDQMTRLIRTVGERSRDANRVEVPFAFVAPQDQEIWTSDSRKGISIPIGRAGATKRQWLKLGIGTAQHALIAGKTGSGKSTFLHAMITNLALHYSPDEIQLYLIDFKKGIEFKMYAAQQLPHAKVIAVESEREFGLSVLQRLDVELKLRGERFRDAGVNDVAGFRDRFPDQSCPRILLVVDEFQEFFVEEDKQAQEASLLLDRLVRQGRAFGLHVFLGSQTLGGAYSLARSTIDQMAVRIALQCSDADAQLILSKDNSAARLLSRPGEAIYNDQNGLSEGNHLFQIVWLPEKDRETRLSSLRNRVKHQLPKPIIFEGANPAFLHLNPVLKKWLEQPNWPKESRVANILLGDPIAIQDSTMVIFRPQSSQNLLMIGQEEETALSLFCASILSLAAQFAPDKVEIDILDMTNEDDPNWGTLKKVTDQLPHRIHFIERAKLGAALQTRWDEVSARQKGTSTDRTHRFILIHGLQRIRDLRKEEDSGYSRRGAERVSSPSELFSYLLREGPGFATHLIMWCDTITNLNRSIDRQGLRECALRILFQMGANDSSILIDTPAASKLGRNRALLVTEELARAEKFRPFMLPEPAWLAEFKNRSIAKVQITEKDLQDANQITEKSGLENPNAVQETASIGSANHADQITIESSVHIPQDNSHTQTSSTKLNGVKHPDLESELKSNHSASDANSVPKIE